MTELAFTSERLDDATVLSIAGEIDMASADALRDQVAALDVAEGILVLDLAGVGFVDSSGLGALLGVKKQQEAAGGRLVLTRVSPAVARLLEITKLDRVFGEA
ncbi:MAG: anti-anti-sigma factor [Aeromicrobium sp.]|nr:anti-anti-sigma factor [Aeromicrobium sp.]